MKIFAVAQNLKVRRREIFRTVLFFRVVSETPKFAVLQELEQHIVNTNPEMAYAEVIPSLKDKSDKKPIRTRLLGEGSNRAIFVNVTKRLEGEGELWDGKPFKVDYIDRPNPVTVKPEDFLIEVVARGLTGKELGRFIAQTYGNIYQIRISASNPNIAAHGILGDLKKKRRRSKDVWDEIERLLAL